MCCYISIFTTLVYSLHECSLYQYSLHQSVTKSVYTLYQDTITPVYSIHQCVTASMWVLILCAYYISLHFIRSPLPQGAYCTVVLLQNCFHYIGEVNAPACYYISIHYTNVLSKAVSITSVCLLLPNEYYINVLLLQYSLHLCTTASTCSLVP